MLEDEALGEAANRALSTSHYKEAIELCKELCKRAPGVENRERLAAAYAGRAKDLAAKGMVKEAVALWRNRADFCATPLLEGPYPGWLRQIGDMKSLLQAYRACLQKDDADDVRRAGLAAIEPIVAAHALTVPDTALADLPADSLLMRSRPQALAALKAYSESDVDLDAALKAIPYRSPYRDLGRILKLMARLESEPAAALDELERISPSSPFARLAAIATTAALPAARWMMAVLALHGMDRALALEFKNIPENSRSLLDDLLRLGERPAPGALFDWLLRQRHRAPQSAIDSLCRSLLAQAPDRVRVYRQAVGGLSDADAERLLALHAESKGNLASAVRHWLRAVDGLCQDGGKSARLRAALILRHLAELAPEAADGGPRREAMNWLRQSLEFDPDDPDVVVQLLAAYRQRRDLKSARVLLDEGMTRFPKNAAILLEAIEVALASNAFKKAAGYAREVLDLDPINPRVRSLLGHAHMAHARKQIKVRKFDAASRELAEAAQWLRAPADRAALKRLRGIVDIDAGHAAEGQYRLNEAAAEAGGALLGYFHLAMEMVRLGRDPVKSLRPLGLPPPKVAAADDVMALVRALEHYKDETDALRKAMAPLQHALLAGIAQVVLEGDFLLGCETFLRLGLVQLVFSLADAARKRFPRSPIFIYHRVNARYGQRPWSIPSRDYSQLIDARDQAEDAGDRRTAARIDQLLAPPEPAMDFDDEPLFEGPDSGGGEVGAPFDADSASQLLEAVGPQRFLDMARKALGKTLFKQLETTVGKDQLVPLLLEMFRTADGGAVPPMLPSKPVKPKGGPIADDRHANSGQGDLFDD